ncbi:hypothetical protein [Luteipulveratus flavus]|uniref:Uncharacterized protein n=1 Tax=Luteipulveratus flavus TaxID=3031728 RepID=A0ABT6CA17_9MICO|nr:hypothetical protein [Luteipulveratus sp. YIM 133296]MDF8265202.1 hypothetical protein [Luteipulveratus sp. YIM 133296]
MSSSRFTTALVTVGLAAGVTGTVALARPAEAGQRTAVTAGALPTAGSKAWGWTAAIQHSTSSRDDQGRLVLISPAGASNPVGEVSDDAMLDDVSYDGRRIITSRWIGTSVEKPLRRVAIWDAATRKATFVTLAIENTDRISIVSNGFLVRDKATQRVQLRSFTGALLTTYAAVSGTHDGPIATPGGGHFMESRGEGVVIRDSATGAVTRTVSAPTGWKGCAPLGGWDASSFVMTCFKPVDDNRADDRPFRVGFTSSVPTTPVTTSAGSWHGAWPTSAPLIGMPARIGDGRAAKVVNGSPVTVRTTAAVTGAVGDKAYLMGSRASTGLSAIDVVNLTTGATSRLTTGLYSDAQTIDQVG